MARDIVSTAQAVRTLRRIRKLLNEHMNYTRDRGEDAVPLLRVAHVVDAMINTENRKLRSLKALAKR